MTRYYVPTNKKFTVNKLKISIHPLFVAAGILSAVFGGLPVFLIYTLTALLHECGHIFCARGLGFYCSKVKLMPYGAAAVCEIDGISARDEVKLALAGPAVNAAICVACAGLWWFYPVTYAFTDTVMQANAIMLAINILPAYPLDGGRVARCVLGKIMPARAVNIVLRCITVLVAAGVASLYFFTDVGVNCFAFSAFLVCSAFTKSPPACKINFADKKKLRRGLEIKYILADRTLTYSRALRYLDDKSYIIFRTQDGEEVTQDRLCEKFETCGIYDSIFDECPKAQCVRDEDEYEYEEELNAAE